jgi:hypothetical protein
LLPIHPPSVALSDPSKSNNGE